MGGWSRLDDAFHARPEIVSAGVAAAGVFFIAWSYCSAYGTDGFVSDDWVKRTGKQLDHVTLVRVGLWVKVAEGEVHEVTGRQVRDGKRRAPDVEVLMPGPGYFMPEFLHSNFTAAEVAERTGTKAAAGRLGGLAKAAAGRSDA